MHACTSMCVCVGLCVCVSVSVSVCVCVDLLLCLVVLNRLKPLDVAFMKTVHHKVNIVPVLAKADTLTKQEVINLKRRV